MIRTGKQIAAMLDSRITSKLKVIVVEFVHHPSFYLATEHFFRLSLLFWQGDKGRIEPRDWLRITKNLSSVPPQRWARFYCSHFFQGLHVCTGTLFFLQYYCGPNISICSSFSKHSTKTIIFENYKFPLQIACLTRSVY